MTYQIKRHCFKKSRPCDRFVQRMETGWGCELVMDKKLKVSFPSDRERQGLWECRKTNGEEDGR